MFLDAYLMNSKEEVTTENFQLLGVTCLHISSKIEEIYPPHIMAFVESTSDLVSIDDIKS